MVISGPCQGHRKVDPKDQLDHDGQGHKNGAGPNGVSGEGHQLLASTAGLLKGRSGQFTALNRMDI